MKNLEQGGNGENRGRINPNVAELLTTETQRPRENRAFPMETSQTAEKNNDERGTMK